MVSTLKKLYVALWATLFTTFAGSLTLEVNDSGTWRLPDEVYVNDSGTWRAIEQVSINDSGTWRTSYQASITSIVVGQQGSFFGYAHPNFSPVPGSSISNPAIEVPGIGTLVVLMDDNTLDTLQMYVCTSDPLVLSSFSRLIVYDTAGTSYQEFPTSSASVFNSDLNVTSNCSTIPADSGSFDFYEWRWSTPDFWNASDVGGSRKVLLVR